MSEPKLILLAEDNVNDIELTLAALAEGNLAREVVVVRDGVEALDYLHHRGASAQRPPGLPGGLDVLRALKSDAQLKLLPVVLLSSSREEGDVLRCDQLGVSACVVKPVDFGPFAAAIQQLGRFWGSVNEPPPAPRLTGAAVLPP